MQSASEEVAKAGAEVPWPAAERDPEANAALLARLLVFLGVAEQRARGLLDVAQAASVLDEAVLTTDAAGSLLVVNRGFEPSFPGHRPRLSSLEHEVTSSDDGVGRIEYLDEGTPYVLTLVPVHVGAVRVSLGDADGRRLSSRRAPTRAALEALRTALLAPTRATA